MADSNAYAHLYIDPGSRNQFFDIRELKIEQEPFMHEMATIHLLGSYDDDYQVWDPGLPIMIEYGRAPLQCSYFYGYILELRRDWTQWDPNPADQRNMTVIAAGASWPLRDDTTAAFDNTSTADIVTSIAQGSYFSADVVNSGYQWPHYHFGGGSSWQLLTDLAERTGAIMYMHGTEIRFYPPTTVLERGATVIPTFFEKDSTLGRTVLSFTSANANQGGSPSRWKTHKRYDGINIQTGDLIAANHDGTGLGPYLAGRYVPPQFSERVSNLVATDQAQAASLLSAKATATRFAIRANAVFSGNISLVPHSPVVVEGLGFRSSGLWQVLRVCHHFKRQWFASECHLGRDSDFDTGARPGLSADLARAQYDPYETVVFNSPPTVLVNGRWRAQWLAQGSVSNA